MEIPTLKSLVQNQDVHFQMYRKNELWYQTDSGFLFPVPIADTGDGEFLKKDKAMFFMRYIRQHLANIQEELNAQENQTPTTVGP